MRLDMLVEVVSTHEMHATLSTEKLFFACVSAGVSLQITGPLELHATVVIAVVLQCGCKCVHED